MSLLKAGAGLQMLIYGNQADAETLKELNARQVDQLAKIMGSSVESVMGEIEDLM